MNPTKLFATFFLLFLFITPSAAQNSEVQNYPTVKTEKYANQFALRANLLRWATLTPDLGVEWRFMEHWGVLVEGAWTSWEWKNNERRYALWEIAPQVRYYFSGFYVGGQYKAGAFNYKFSETGKQGDIMGGGITGGYLLPIGKALSLDFNLGAGYLNTKYETYQVQEGIKVKKGSFVKNYWGVTDVGVSLVWTIK